MARILGLDYGTKRLGFAQSDPMEIIASPLEVVTVQSMKQALRATREMCEKIQAEKVVVGMPLNMDGEKGPIAIEVTEFIEKLKKQIHIPVDICDERMTSQTARSVLIEGGTRRDKRKKLIDKVAAQIILQHYLDSQSGGVEIPPMQD